MDMIDLKELEKKAYQSVFQDGLWDIAWGVLFFAGWALIPILESLDISRYWGYPALFLPAVIITLGKRFITVPRMGVVNFSPARQRRRIWLIACVVAMVLFSSLIWTMSETSSSIWRNDPFLSEMLVALPIMAIFWVVAYLMDFSRLYLYAAVFGAAMPVSRSLGPSVGEPLIQILIFGIPSLLIITFGLLLLVRFLLKYPAPSGEIIHD